MDKREHILPGCLNVILIEKFLEINSLFIVVSGCSSKYLNIDNVESCPDHHGYDYFKGSELSFIVLWTCFGVIPFGKLKFVSLHKIYSETIYCINLGNENRIPVFFQSVYCLLTPLLNAGSGNIPMKSEKCRIRSLKETVETVPRVW